MMQPFLAGLHPHLTGVTSSGGRSPALSQWYSPPALARRIVSWAHVDAGMRVLEPAAGRGALIDPLEPLIARCAIRVVAYDIDDDNAQFLEDRWRFAIEVRAGDFLADCPQAGERFHLAITNPPYEDNADAAFVLRCLEVSDRVVALVRSAFLHGGWRRAQVWRRAELRRLAILSERPRFDGPVSGSPISDFVVVELVRRAELRGAGEHDTPTVEWW